MQIKTSQKQVKADLLVIPVFKTKKIAISGLSKTHQLTAKTAFAKKIFTGELGQTLTLYNDTTLLLGLGEEKEISNHKLKQLYVDFI